MRWIFTNDHYYDPSLGIGHRIGLSCGFLPGIAASLRTMPIEEARKAAVTFVEKVGLVTEFQLLTDDGDLVYSGFCDSLDDATEAEAFAPLDWAMADAGCTTMMYRLVKDGPAAPWVQL